MNFDPYPTYKASGLPPLGEMPQHWEVRRLRTMVEMRVSNVDKHTKEEELPVRLCNYLDVYKNDRITQRLPFMVATATWDELENFRLNRNDVVITKDSEAWDDIGVPALVTEPSEDLVSGYHLAILRPREDVFHLGTPELNARSYSRADLLRYKIAPKYPLSGPFRHSGVGRNPGAVGPVRSYNLNFTYPYQPSEGGRTRRISFLGLTKQTGCISVPRGSQRSDPVRALSQRDPISHSSSPTT